MNETINSIKYLKHKAFSILPASTLVRETRTRAVGDHGIIFVSSISMIIYR